MKKKIFLILIVGFIILGGIFLRSNYLFAKDFYFLSDQARDLLLVKEIVENKKPVLIGARAGLGGLFHGPLWLYMLLPFFLVFKGNPFFISLVFIFISVLILTLSYFLFNRLFGSFLAFVFLLFIANSKMLVNLVPYTTNAHIMPLIFLFFLYFLLNFIKNGRKYDLFLAAFFSGLGFQFEAAFAIFLLPTLLFSYFLKKYQGKIRIKELIFLMFFFILPLSTHILFDLRHDFLMTKSFLHFLKGSPQPIKGYEQYSQFLFRLKDRTLLLKRSFAMVDSYRNYFTFFLFLLFFLVVLRYKKFSSSNKIIIKTVLFFFILFFGFYLLYPYPVWEHYIFSLFVFNSFILSFFMNLLSHFSKKELIDGVVIFSILILVFLDFSKKIKLNITRVYSLSKGYASSDGSFRNQLKVVDEIFKDAHGKHFGYFVSSSQVFTYGMDYLFWWRGKYKYGFIPESKKGNLYYLIVYPKGEDEDYWLHWKKTKIKVRNLFEREILFPGKIRVFKVNVKLPEKPVDNTYYMDFR